MLFLAFCGCAHRAISSDKTYILELRGPAGQRDRTHFYSHNKTDGYEDGQLLRERDEIVDFQVETIMTTAKPGQISFRQKTIHKDGPGSLHDLAFPEMGETLTFVLTRQARVLKVDDYPPSSLFFIPPLPLPNGPVRVGDTWLLKHVWKTRDTEIPLLLQVVGILKEVMPCPAGTCARIDLSGDVQVDGPFDPHMQFNGELSGEVIFAIDKGIVVSSMIDSDQEMHNSVGRMHNRSCLVGRLEEPAGWAVKNMKWPCTPPP